MRSHGAAVRNTGVRTMSCCKGKPDVGARFGLTKCIYWRKSGRGLGWGRMHLREARRHGLPVRKIGRRSYVSGRCCERLAPTTALTSAKPRPRWTCPRRFAGRKVNQIASPATNRPTRIAPCVFPRAGTVGKTCMPPIVAKSAWAALAKRKIGKRDRRNVADSGKPRVLTIV